MIHVEKNFETFILKPPSTNWCIVPSAFTIFNTQKILGKKKHLDKFKSTLASSYRENQLWKLLTITLYGKLQPLYGNPCMSLKKMVGHFFVPKVFSLMKITP